MADIKHELFFFNVGRALKIPVKSYKLADNSPFVDFAGCC